VKRESLKLYFIALVPEQKVFSEVLNFKEEFKDRFNSKAALRSPPHITLHMPFQWKEEKEHLLVGSLDDLANRQIQFNIELENFGAFPPRVIYVNVIESNPLDEMFNSVQKVAHSEWHIYPKSTNSRPFKPHMTIAFRDLKKSDFHNAWKEFVHREYQAEFNASDICLLKHNGRRWDVVHNSPIR
jgi:2'-5' RNA ligase